MNQIFPPAALWLGTHEQLIQRTQRYLQKIFCSFNACTVCSTCRAITNRQHHALLWLYPEKQYTLATLEPIFETIAYKLDLHERFFFIIQKADALTELCQNMLLKTIEEPPAGYHFLLLSEKKEQILPTIQSRCQIITVSEEISFDTLNPYIEFFTEKTKNIKILLEEIEKNCPTERESIEILDSIIAHWLSKYTQALPNNNFYQEIEKKLKILMHAQQQLPMPGSSKLFWKNLFLQWQ